ncbi:hypothetical protein [Streptosporangium sp. NBC_01756]|uniref:hypothetical protein n=1 Tax=Streptosporangium sp. NBC_01756 TaxID=2975950 RepID=UPI002DD86DF1|nr:hypothetical protein [Streptosporangium sp. NBC_01756]WSC88379.1 hypothetical protein OIE48_09390 [Streptosporangium sp. NBC_01756]
MADWNIPEFDVTRCPDGTWEARFKGTPAEDPADATAGTFRYLELLCCAKRIGRSLREACDRNSSSGTRRDHG